MRNTTAMQRKKSRSAEEGDIEGKRRLHTWKGVFNGGRDVRDAMVLGQRAKMLTFINGSNVLFSHGPIQR